ncbi:MAG: hypothetical protein KGL53_11015, partial [Elusimicrobia bacterium]|nr:hypothetical protein [Elusimicrobiota bacterium]
FIGSRTKGTTHAKEFKGNTQFTSQDILDTSYIRRRYYDLTFGDTRRLPLVAGSERVFLSVAAGGQQNVNQITRTADDLAVQSSTYTGTFVEMARGVDYTVDYVKGIITFRNSLDPNAVVAVDFTDATGVPLSQQKSTVAFTSGGSGLPKLIKTFGDVQISTTSEAGYQRELKTFYSIGANQILRDDGRGNFFLKVFDQNRNEVGPSLNPPQKYPDTILVDFENGTFQLQQPFSVSNSSPGVPDPEVYAPSPLTKRLFHLEYHFRLKTFFLEPNIVLQSEVVLVDGQKLARNVDYFIDYESGFLTFFNPDRIQPDSTIDVSYEVAPFAGNATDSLLGGRVGYELWKNHWKVGSTLLYQTGSKSPTVPSVTELARSLLVYEADTQLMNLRLGSWLTASFGGEVAQSRTDPNLNKFALIDNMESVRQDDTASLTNTYWQVTPGPTAKGQDAFPDPTGFSIGSYDEQILVINPNAPAKQGETQKVLTYHYDFNLAKTTETAMVYTFSPTGLDFSQKTVIEVVLEEDQDSGNELAIDLGGFNEDADGTGGQTLTCANGSVIPNAPATEDQNCDTILQPGEDIGWLYHPLGKNAARYGAGNGILDSEDLNRNGRLDSEDFSGGRFGYDAPPSLPINIEDVTNNSDLQNNVLHLPPGQYHTLHISLASATADASRWLAVKELRIAVRHGASGAYSGTFKIARVAVVGNTWQKGTPGDISNGAPAKGGESLEVTAVNNVDNPEYKGRAIQTAGGDATAVFNDLYGSLSQLQQQSNSNNVSEQALQLRWSDLEAGATVFTKRTFATALDISQHHYFNFLLYGNAQESSCPGSDLTAVGGLDGKRNDGKTFFLRAGADHDFFEVRVPLNFCGWKKISVEQRDTTGNQIPDTWFIASAPPGSVTLSSGTPNLQQVGALYAGVYSSVGTSTDEAHALNGAVYLNEIHVAGPITRVGNAEKVQADFTVPGWAAFGGKFRYVDRNFETPTTVVSNQDNLQETGYLNLTRMSWLPMSFNVNYSKITTPNTNAVGTLSNTVGLLSQGTVRTWNGTATGTFQRPALPRVTVTHERNRIEYDPLSGRLDDRRTYKGAASYSPTWRHFFVPRSIDGDYTYSRYGVTFQTDQSRATSGNFNTDELTDGFDLKLAFEPWKGSSFNPSYSLNKVHENRQDFSTGLEVDKSYDKALQQTVGFTSNWNVMRWLKPSVSYTESTIENNILNVSTFTTATSTHVFDIGEIKTVNRNANGNVSLSLAAAEMFPRTKLWRSFALTNSYQLQDGDVWNNVESGLDTRKDLWLRSPLRPKNPFAQLATLTLRDTFNSTQRWSPFEAYDLKGRRAPFKTFSLTNNYVKSIQRSETTGTPSKTVATTLPDLIASMGNLEQLLHADHWAKNMQMNVKFSERKTENVAVSLETDDAFGTDLRSIIKKRFDTSVSFNLRTSDNEDLRLNQLIQSTDHKDATVQTTFDVRKFRFTPKFDYQSDVTTLGTGQRSQDTTVMTPSLLVRADISLPRGLKLPLMHRILTFTNRVIWTNTVSLAVTQSPITIQDNSKLLNLNSSADYEIAKNLRMTLNAAVSRLWHKYLQEENYISYQFGTTLTFQF